VLDEQRWQQTPAHVGTLPDQRLHCRVFVRQSTSRIKAFCFYLSIYDLESGVEGCCHGRNGLWTQIWGVDMYVHTHVACSAGPCGTATK
jgi:hypothetical protein